jgi:hypothetical protein
MSDLAQVQADPSHRPHPLAPKTVCGFQGDEVDFETAFHCARIVDL